MCIRYPGYSKGDPDRNLYRPDDYEYIRRMKLFLWFHHGDALSEEEDKGIDGLETHLLTTVYFTVLDRLATELEIDTFVLTDIIDEYGALPILNRLADTFRRCKMTNSQLFRIQLLMQSLLLRPEFLPHYAASGVIEALRTALDCCERENAALQCAVLIITLEIYQ